MWGVWKSPWLLLQPSWPSEDSYGWETVAAKSVEKPSLEVDNLSHTREFMGLLTRHSRSLPRNPLDVRSAGKASAGPQHSPPLIPPRNVSGETVERPCRAQHLTSEKLYRWKTNECNECGKALVKVQLSLNVRKFTLWETLWLCGVWKAFGSCSDLIHHEGIHARWTGSKTLVSL